MKMPASESDPVSTTLRFAFSTPSKTPDLDKDLEISAKRVLMTKIEYEPATNYHTNVLNSLKTKYIVISTKTNLNNSKLVNGNVKKSNGACLPSPKYVLFSPEKVQKGYRANTPVGSGMLNMGNTCYLNSTLQALFHVPAFVNWLLSESSHQKCEQHSDYQIHPDDICCAVVKTLKCAQSKTGTVMKPVCVYSKLKAICKHLTHGSQEDAHEFMRYLLESLEKNYLVRCAATKYDNFSKETTPVNQIFGGYIRTEVTCLACKEVSTTFQHFQDLPLDIRKYSTLDDALAGYFERERLPDGEDAYKCEKCNRKVSATKKFSVERPPNVLCAQLKRFSALNGKITKQVQLPQYLDLTRFISTSQQPRSPVKYKLVAMITHMGPSANCGHYTAIALAGNGYYYQFDDGSVRQITLSTVLNMQAYIVIYEMERSFTSPITRPQLPLTSTSTCVQQPVRIPTQMKKIPQQTGNFTLKREGPAVQARDSPPTKKAPMTATAAATATISPTTTTTQSLVPYDSDSSDTEKSKSELEKLLTDKKILNNKDEKLQNNNNNNKGDKDKLNLKIDVNSTEKGWQVTTNDVHLDSPLHSESSGQSATSSTSSWKVTKLKRHSSNDMFDKKKEKFTRHSSDTELIQKNKKRSVLEKYMVNFTDGQTKNEIIRKINNDTRIISRQNDENSPNKWATPSPSKKLNDDKCNERLNSPLYEAKKHEGNDVVRNLMQNSHHGYGTAGVKSWNGGDSSLGKEVEEEREETKKRSSDDLFNEEFDRGKCKKMRFNGEDRDRNNRPQYNAFQQRANQQQQSWRWRGHNNYYGHGYNREDRYNKYHQNTWKYPPNNKNKYKYNNQNRYFNNNNRFSARY